MGFWSPIGGSPVGSLLPNRYQQLLLSPNRYQQQLPERSPIDTGNSLVMLIPLPTRPARVDRIILLRLPARRLDKAVLSKFGEGQRGVVIKGVVANLGGRPFLENFSHETAPPKVVTANFRGCFTICKVWRRHLPGRSPGRAVRPDSGRPP